MNEINAYIEEIKNYSEKHTELKKSHHFCFNIPIQIGNTKPELKQGDEIVLIMGQNPGEKDGTWNYFPKNLERKHKNLFNIIGAISKLKNCNFKVIFAGPFKNHLTKNLLQAIHDYFSLGKVKI